MSKVWHRLLHESGKHVWAMNRRVVTNPCVSSISCPGNRPMLMEGRIEGHMLWYLPQDVMQTVHVLNGTVTDIVHGCGTCAQCNKQFSK